MNTVKHIYYKDFLWAVNLNRFGLELIGLWPPKMNKNYKNNYMSDLRAIIDFIIIAFVFVIPLICALVRVRHDMILVIDNLQVTLPFIVLLMKILVMRWKQTVILSIIKIMAKDWMSIKLNAERKVMIKQASAARLIMICGYVLMIFIFILTTIFPFFGLSFRHLTNLTDRERPLPMQTYYFYDTDKSPLFEFMYIIQTIGIFLGCISYSSIDGFFGLVVLHICGQLKNFRYRLLNLISWKNFNSDLRNNIIIHLRLIRFVDKIEDVFALMMLVLVVYFSIVFCLYSFLLLIIISDSKTNNISISQMLYILIGIIILFSHTFLFCGAGELVTEQCEAIYHTICKLEWYKLEPEKARNFILLIKRTSEPFRITAGKIIPLTMSTFCTLLKTSTGYVSFLLTKQN